MSYDAFLYFDKIVKGETLDKEFSAKHAIQVYSFSWGLSNPSSVGHGKGLGAGKVDISAVSIMKRVDSASSDLMLCCAAGQHLGTATMVLRKAGGDKALHYLTFTLTDVMIDSVQVSGSSGGDDYPMESVSIAFAQVKMSYLPQKEDGTGDTAKEFGWNMETNVKA